MVDYALNDYHRARHSELIDSSELRSAWSEVAERLYFRGLRPGSRILEFGGGLGANLISVAARHETWMVEPSQIGRDIAASAGIRTAALLAEIDPSVSFDFILCRHCLEHVDEPFSVLRSLKERMREGSNLMLVLPVEKADLMPSDHDIDHHLYAWHPRAIVNLLSRVGFRVAEVRFEFFDGRRRLLPLRRLAGAKPYVTAVRYLGRALRSRELVVSAFMPK